MFPNFYIINTFRTRYCHFFVYNSSLLTFECLFVVFYRILLHCHFENIVLDFECLSLLLWLLSISTFHSFNCVVLVRSSNVDWRLNFLLKFSIIVREFCYLRLLLAALTVNLLLALLYVLQQIKKPRCLFWFSLTKTKKKENETRRRPSGLD